MYQSQPQIFGRHFRTIFNLRNGSRDFYLPTLLPLLLALTGFPGKMCQTLLEFKKKHYTKFQFLVFLRWRLARD